MINHLEQLKKARLTGLAFPSLVQDPDLSSIFRMLDPAGHGHITYSQYGSSKIISRTNVFNYFDVLFSNGCSRYSKLQHITTW